MRLVLNVRRIIRLLEMGGGRVWNSWDLGGHAKKYGLKGAKGDDRKYMVCNMCVCVGGGAIWLQICLILLHHQGVISKIYDYGTGWQGNNF